MAGTWLVVKPAVILAMSAVLLDRTVALYRPPAGQHHRGVLLDGHVGHRANGLLKAETVGGEDLGEEVDVAALADRGVVVASENRLLLRLRHRPLVDIGSLVGLEPLAILCLHQTHAELIERVALARALRGEHRGAGDVVELGDVHAYSPSQ